MWMFGVTLGPGSGSAATSFAAGWPLSGIETRTFFVPMHLQPAYHRAFAGQRYPVAERLGRDGLYLPSGPSLTESRRRLCRRGDPRLCAAGVRAQRPGLRRPRPGPRSAARRRTFARRCPARWPRAGRAAARRSPGGRARRRGPRDRPARTSRASRLVGEILGQPVTGAGDHGQAGAQAPRAPRPNRWTRTATAARTRRRRPGRTRPRAPLRATRPMSERPSCPPDGGGAPAGPRARPGRPGSARRRPAGGCSARRSTSVPLRPAWREVQRISGASAGVRAPMPSGTGGVSRAAGRTRQARSRGSGAGAGRFRSADQELPHGLVVDEHEPRLGVPPALDAVVDAVDPGRRRP